MIVGFTGTRFGLTTAQAESLIAWLRSNEVEQFHHGDCVGADAFAASFVSNFCLAAKIHCRPCNFADMRAYTPSHVTYDVKTAFARNRDIVDACDVLLACPFTKGEQPRGGTWYTIRYARKKSKPVVLFAPDGSVCEDKS